MNRSCQPVEGDWHHSICKLATAVDVTCRASLGVGVRVRKVVTLELDLQVKLGFLQCNEGFEFPCSILVLLKEILEKLGVDLTLVGQQNKLEFLGLQSQFL